MREKEARCRKHILNNTKYVGYLECQTLHFFTFYDIHLFYDMQPEFQNLVALSKTTHEVNCITSLNIFTVALLLLDFNFDKDLCLISVN
jgi:hypothetical protein